MSDRRRALFLSHGGGPLPLLGDETHLEMISCLQGIANTVERPSAIVVVSAHWEENVPTVTSGATPELIYDYHGFPEESYSIEYPCPGNPLLAQTIVNQLGLVGIDVQATDKRGFDHGLFVPLKIMYPEADIPCVQLSLIHSLNPLRHLELGRALRGVLDDSVLLIGSGFSFHNMRAFFSPETEESRTANEQFEQWLMDTCCSQSISEDDRAELLSLWSTAPNARYCHPREEHLLPLHVCYGFAGAACSQSFELKILNKKSSMFYWDIEA